LGAFDETVEGLVGGEVVQTHQHTLGLIDPCARVTSACCSCRTWSSAVVGRRESHSSTTAFPFPRRAPCPRVPGLPNRQCGAQIAIRQQFFSGKGRAQGQCRRVLDDVVAANAKVGFLPAQWALDKRGEQRTKGTSRSVAVCAVYGVGRADDRVVVDPHTSRPHGQRSAMYATE
jgi:hypothetical protein